MRVKPKEILLITIGGFLLNSVYHYFDHGPLVTWTRVITMVPVYVILTVAVWCVSDDKFPRRTSITSFGIGVLLNSFALVVLFNPGANYRAAGFTAVIGSAFLVLTAVLRAGFIPVKNLSQRAPTPQDIVDTVNRIRERI